MGKIILFQKSLLVSTTTSALVALFLFGDLAKGIPVPFRENQRDSNFGDHQYQPHQIKIPIIPRNMPPTPLAPGAGGQPDEHHYNSRHKRHEERPNHLYNNYGQQAWRQPWSQNNNNNDHPSREFGSQPQNPGGGFHQNQYHKSPYGNNHNNHHRERRNVPYIVKYSDGQLQPDDQQNPNLNSFFSDDYGYCTNPDCKARMDSNEIRNENPYYNNNNNNPSYGKESNKIRNPTIPHHTQGSKNENINRIPFPVPSQIIQPPPPMDMQQQQQQYQNNQGNFREFYGQPDFDLDLQQDYYPNYPTNDVDDDEEGYYVDGQFHTGLFPPDFSNTFYPPPSSPDLNIISIRTSRMSLGDNLEIVKVVLDISSDEGADNESEETYLEAVDDA